MQASLLWTGREYYSLENCLITSNDFGNEINSTIVGLYQNKIYTAEYHIQTDNNWLTNSLKLNYQINNKQCRLELERNVNNEWILNNKSMDEFDDCLYVDISITPFTNTLPVNSLGLSSNEQQKIKVIYINVFVEQVRAVEQMYQRLPNTRYLYQNVPNNFEAEIEFDEFGFVVDYPYLFERTAAIKFN
jgi:hypothetical protein